MLENFIDSALIIDDKEEEILKLKEALEEKDIWVRFNSPSDIASITKPIKNRKVIFLDLYLSDTTTDLIGNISEIRAILRKIIGSDFGSYGIVIWSAHIDEIEMLKQKIQLDSDKYQIPSFIVGLSKMNYLKDDSYTTIIEDLDNLLKANTAAYFFMQWDALVKKGKHSAVSKIYNLCKDYENQENDLKFILLKLAQNYSGLPANRFKDHNLEADSFKAFTDLLHYDIVHQLTEDFELFKEPDTIKYSKPDETDKIFAGINSKLLLDFTNISQAVPIPGNIYKINENNDGFKILEIVNPNNKKSLIPINNKIPDCLDVIIEVTPPCDFSNNKKANKSRFISGVIFDYTDRKQLEYFPGDSFYKELYPINIEGFENPKMIIFDFRYLHSIDEKELEDSARFEILCKAKDKLFADILQKLSSHTARLGLSIIR